jgi:hypothetical protein
MACALNEYNYSINELLLKKLEQQSLEVKVLVLPANYWHKRQASQTDDSIHCTTGLLLNQTHH